MNRSSWPLRFSLAVVLAAGSVFCPLGNGAQAAQQFQGLCSVVKIEILQEMTLERIGFLATLEITNNEGEASITDFAAQLTFENPLLSEAENPNDASALFFVQPPTFQGINAIDGNGIIRPAQTARVSWFIIPKISAGGTAATGVRYRVGAQLAGSIYGAQIDPAVLEVIPDVITVKPDPELDITYFQPRDVEGDDPFTPEIVETPIPFTLGVLVHNVGYGKARSVKIASQQPRIVENKQSLLIVARLLGARVDDKPRDETSLTVDLGDIEPGMCRKGAWDMITSLSGEFIEFKASYSHASELGGRDTSVIRNLNAYFIVHEVLNDQRGRDGMLDFLADTVRDADLVPDALYESDCNVLPVNSLQNVTVAAFNGLTATLHATADFENWVYLRLDDPAQAKFQISSVVRSDGKVLNPHNYWTNVRYERGTNRKLTYLNIFDFVSLGQHEYTVTYAPPTQDTVPPVTALRFSGPVQEQNGKFLVSPATQIYFTAEDASPVGTYYRLDGAGVFQPAYPFSIEQSGEHALEYYSRDAAGNAETSRTATVVLSDLYPGIASLAADTDTLFIAGDALSVRPTQVTIGFEGQSALAGLQGEVEVFRGASGWPTVGGVPSSPAASHGAALTIGGENVDFYRYRLGSGVWSVEAPIAQPLQLTSLGPGAVQVSIAGRSRSGDYRPDSEAVVVSWTVDDGAALAVLGAPATPTRNDGVTLTVTGSEYYCYRVDETFYRPNMAAAAPITLTRLSEGDHKVEVLPRVGAGSTCPADGAGTLVQWKFDRQYGLRFPAAERVYHAALGVGPSFEFRWDGKDDGGAVVPPGWYSILLSVRDALGRSTGTVSLLQVGDMLSDGQVLSEVGNAAQKEAHACGKWVVWQDQRGGNWDIYAQELATGAPSVAITDSPLNQERPRTDGRYVVWEDRQPDGTWDIRARALGATAAAFAVTATPESDERKPVIDWPWVVYQAKPVSNPGASWQLLARNMLTGDTVAIDPTVQDQVEPAISGSSVVWQDFRDVGPGEIYLKNLKTGAVKRITDNPAGQYWPAISDQWIVWSDARNTQLDLYGYNLLRGAEVRLTQTPEDESRPHINGKWVVYEEDGAGEALINIRLLSLANRAVVQLTNFGSVKEIPSTASGWLVWVDARSGVRRAMIGTLPDLQPVFDNLNTVAVTTGMAARLPDAHQLLRVWNREAGITGITRYTALLPQPVAETVSWEGGQPSGDNFTLEPGGFLWVKFGDMKILDLGTTECAAIGLASGTNVFSYSCFPDRFSAYGLIRELGPENVRALRLLDAETGRWVVATVVGGAISGEDFTIPQIAVLMLDMSVPISDWRPGE